MTFRERIKKAVMEDNSIVVTKTELSNPEFKHSGFGMGHLEYLGLRKSDLRKLEHAGMAVRTYAKEFTGNQTRWLLLEDK